MSKLYQDSIGIMRRFGKPTLFITMTANPNWPEITENLNPRIQTQYDPSLAATVFNLKRKALVKDLETYFGQRVACCWTIEYQKRGLPHMHLLLFLSRDCSFLNPAWIDDFISAELPTGDLATNIQLRSVVESCMIHGPCGIHNPKAPCMKPNAYGTSVCSKGFPKPFQNQTTVSENGYPCYQRRPGPHILRTVKGHQIQVGNDWIVPYSPVLSLKYNCHINIEVCETIKAIRYIHKYVYKGDDRGTLQPQADEIKQYQSGQYIDPVQATYQLLEYHMHGESPPVETLPIHLENEQPVYFNEYTNVVRLGELATVSNTALMAYFEYNRRHKQGQQRRLYYHDFPEHFVYVKSLEKLYFWKPRERGTAIGRIIHLSPIAGKKYYLCLLLTKIPGPRSFKHLHTVNGEDAKTYREACLRHGLINDDKEWIAYFEDA